ncbi:hypothetical protein ACWGIP_35925, partial [Streptomyces sp. NPDC054838]
MGVWRWRRNPLRRRTDLFEAWLALAAAESVVEVEQAVVWDAGVPVDDHHLPAYPEQRLARYL